MIKLSELPESYNGDVKAGSYLRNKEVTEPLAVYMGGRIVNVDGYLHSVDGYPIYVDAVIIGTGSDEGNRGLIERVKIHYDSGCTYPMLPGYIFSSFPKIIDGNLRLVASPYHIKPLPEAEKVNIRRFCKAYDIGEH